MPFSTYMDWVLHDSDHGAYGAGHLRIGPRGDFATAPSLGPEFAGLLAPQIAAWLESLGEGPLALLEAGPGEGSLAADLAAALAAGWPELADRTSLVLLEPNPGMAERQRQRLTACPLPLRWSSFAELAQDPPQGVLLAHEVLDALAVERIVSSGNDWCRQEVALTEAGTLSCGPGSRWRRRSGLIWSASGSGPPAPSAPPAGPRSAIRAWGPGLPRPAPRYGAATCW